MSLIKKKIILTITLFLYLDVYAQTCTSLFVPQYAEKFALYREVVEDLHQQQFNGIAPENLILRVNNQVERDIHHNLDYITSHQEEIQNNINLAIAEVSKVMGRKGIGLNVQTLLNALNETKELLDVTILLLNRALSTGEINYLQYRFLTKLTTLYSAFTNQNLEFIPTANTYGLRFGYEFYSNLGQVVGSLVTGLRLLNQSVHSNWASAGRSANDYALVIGIPTTLEVDEIELLYFMANGSIPIDFSIAHSKYDNLSEYSAFTSPFFRMDHDDEHEKTFLIEMNHLVISTTGKQYYSDHKIRGMKLKFLHADLLRFYSEFLHFINAVSNPDKRLIHFLVFFYWSHEDREQFPTHHLKNKVTQAIQNIGSDMTELYRRLNAKRFNPKKEDRNLGYKLLNGRPVSKEEIYEVLTEELEFLNQYEDYEPGTGLRRRIPQ